MFALDAGASYGSNVIQHLLVVVEVLKMQEQQFSCGAV